MRTRIQRDVRDTLATICISLAAKTDSLNQLGANEGVTGWVAVVKKPKTPKWLGN
jgi:hypothetical protein